MSLQFDAAPDELAVFLEEAEEQLQLLDQDILILEREGPSQNLLQEVFRAAHTLKGSSAAIGHERMASLTHAMETVLDYLRKGKIEKSTALIDLLLQSLDALRVFKEEILTLEHSGFDPSSLVSALKQFGERNLAGEPGCQPPSLPSSSGTAGAAKGAACENPNGQLYRITVCLDKDCMFPAARFFQVHLSLAEIGEVTESVPSSEDIEAERVGTELQVACITTEDSHRIKDLVMEVPDVSAVRIENANIPSDVVVEQDALCFEVSAQETENASTQASGDSDGQEKVPGPGERPTAGRATAASKTVRIDIERLDALMNLVGELVIDCTRLTQLSSRLQARYESEEIAQGIGETSQHIQRITDELQDRIMKARMFPVSSVFSRFPRMVRDLAQKVGKKVEFVMEGEETELDRSVIEEISDPLTHLLRNSVDHGIEAPAERLAAGKPEVGRVRLAACHRESRILLMVEDDGKGLNPDLIRQSALEKGVITQEAAGRMADHEIQELIFAPGFSTAKQVSDVSGRGVGMDIVSTNIHKLNGQVSIDSAPGRGSRFILELPLTLAIMDALLVSLRENIFAIPLASVTETLRVPKSEICYVNRERVIQHRGRVLPLVLLDQALGVGGNGHELERAYVVVVGAESGQVGIVVDSLIGEQQVVIKSLGNYIGDVRGLSGATILGDGRVALILDVPALVKKTVQERAGKTVYA